MPKQACDQSGIWAVYNSASFEIGLSLKLASIEIGLLNSC